MTIASETPGANRVPKAGSNGKLSVVWLGLLNQSTPAISGTSSLGGVVTTSNGTWFNAVGGLSYTYQWKRNGVDIGGATSQTYTIVSADIGQNLTCAVTATDGTSSLTITTAAVVPTNAYATFDPATKGANCTLSNGNLTNTVSGAGAALGSISKSSGKWYAEFTVVGTVVVIGVASPANNNNSYPGRYNTALAAYGYMTPPPMLWNDTNPSPSTTGTLFAVGHVISVMIDPANRRMKLWQNGTLIYDQIWDVAIGTTVTFIAGAVASGSCTANFGATAFAYPGIPTAEGANAGLWS